MNNPRVVVVMLRQPKRHDPGVMRTDPLWEFGSFGCTRCHQRNLMNPHRADELRGNLLAFAQGGDSEVRLVHVTPPIRIELHGLFMVDFRSPWKSPRGGSQRERSFAMLGFTHYWGRSRKGRWVVKRKTAKDRFSRALKAVGRWCRNHRHWTLREQQAALSRKLRGHYAYYGITGNYQALNRFRYETERLWRKWLGRRSWRGRMTWERFARLRNTYPLPPARVVHSVCR